MLRGNYVTHALTLLMLLTQALSSICGAESVLRDLVSDFILGMPPRKIFQLRSINSE